MGEGSQSESMVIVVMEPDVFLRFAIVESLRREGHTLIHAAGLEHTKVILQQSSVPINLVLMSLDLATPSEIEACREIAALSPATKIMVMSDHLSAQKRAKAEKWGVIPKPFRATTLRQKVRAALIFGKRKRSAPHGGLWERRQRA